MEDFDLAINLRKEEEEKRRATERNMHSIAIKVALNRTNDIHPRVEILKASCDFCTA